MSKREETKINPSPYYFIAFTLELSLLCINKNKKEKYSLYTSGKPWFIRVRSKCTCTWFNIPKTVENALIKCTFDRFCDKPLKFLKAYKIADLSKYSLPIFLDY